MNFRSGKLIKEGWRYRCIEEWLFNNSDIGKIRQERQTDNGYTSKKKAAFTLAEVLITLGVIGVVASITLPTLIKEYNKHAWVNALKQNYSLLNQGFKKMMADDGVEFIEDTEVWRAIHGTPSYCSSNSSSANCKDFYAQINKYFKITSIGSGTDKFGTGNSMMLGYKYKFRNSSYKSIYLDKIIYLSNGAMIWDYSFSKDSNISSDCDAIHTAGGHMCGEAGSFNIDVNGNRGPNEFGKDIFVFDISERGQLAPLGGNDYAVYRASVGSGDIDSYKTKIGINGECL
ncbi:type II secretion system protein, partial [bacterium]|nr:type II secretion system protein [bacterium]